MPRCEGFKTFAGGGAVVSIRVQRFGPLGTGAGVRRLMQNQETALAPFESRFDGVAQANANFFIDDQAIDDDVDIVLLFGFEFDANIAGQFDQFAIDAGANESFASETFDDIAEFA